ncbi:hypothetical protein N665_0754s0006 [Sinapis alba]|nr:hypothetical protein N665_0754s0006 [Sinapis alba]
MMLASLIFSKRFRQVTMTRAKTSENGVVQQPLSLSDVGLKFLATTPTHRSDERTAKTSVWWDVENCGVPKGCDGHKIALNIKSALEKINYCGPLTIYAYGNINLMTSSVQEALSSTGVSLNHVPPGVKDGSDKKILVDMLLWATQNRAPANMMLISGDGDYSYVLHRLRMMGYNVLLVRPENASRFLIAAANTIWLWRSIVSGGSGSKVLKQAEPRKRVKSDLVAKSKSSKRYCETCNVTCTSLVDFNSHLSSKKHKKKKLVTTSRTNEIIICFFLDRFFCEVVVLRLNIFS